MNLRGGGDFIYMLDGSLFFCMCMIRVQVGILFSALKSKCETN